MKKREYQNDGRIRSLLAIPSDAHFITGRIHISL